MLSDTLNFYLGDLLFVICDRSQPLKILSMGIIYVVINESVVKIKLVCIYTYRYNNNKNFKNNLEKINLLEKNYEREE